MAAAICWSFGGLFLKFIPWGTMSIIGIRAILAASVFAVYRRSVKVTLSPGNIAAAAAVSATTILFVFANKLTTSAAAVILQFCEPVFIIIIHLVFYKKKPKPGEIIAVCVTIAGMLLFFADRLEPGSTLGNILAILSGLTFACVFIFNNRPDVDTDQSLFLAFLINAIIGAPFVIMQVTPDIVVWGAVLFLGIVQVGLAYVFFSLGIKKTPALLACLITAIEPVLNPIWVALVTGETPGLFAIIGGVIIILTITIYNLKEKAGAGTEVNE
jgi:drug/metabolite transporter (DMT)-like permease